MSKWNFMRKYKSIHLTVVLTVMVGGDHWQKAVNFG
jgi:hypothetical protein